MSEPGDGYTEKKAADIVAAIAAGNTRAASAAYAEISDSTLEAWCTAHPEFGLQLAKAEADVEVRQVANIAKAAQAGSWAASAWLLKHHASGSSGPEPDEAEDAPLLEVLGPTGVRPPYRLNERRRQAYLGFLAGGLRRGAAAAAAGVSRMQITRYMATNEEFAKAVDEAEMSACEPVENALYKSAIGGNVIAAQVWLYNRAPGRWSDRRNPRQLEVTGPAGAAVPVQFVTVNVPPGVQGDGGEGPPPEAAADTP